MPNYTKHPHINPAGIQLTPTMNNPVIINDQFMKVIIELLDIFIYIRVFIFRMIHTKYKPCDHHVVLI
jgi:hypothetical protein